MRSMAQILSEFLEQERRALGEWHFRQEYECEFVDSAHHMILHCRVTHIQGIALKVAQLESVIVGISAVTDAGCQPCRKSMTDGQAPRILGPLVRQHHVEI